MSTDNYTIVNIREYLAYGNDKEIGEPALVQLLSDFLCPQNRDVECFLKKSAIEFAKKNQSVTYLVFSNDGDFVGYFNIAIKPLTVNCNAISKTTQKKLLRNGELDNESHTCTLSAYLIGQLGKNFSKGCNDKISGSVLLELALSAIKHMQYMGGGVAAFLEANDTPKLLKFYADNRFVKFDIRKSPKEELHKLIQLLRLL